MQTLEDAIRERYSYDPETGEIISKRTNRPVRTRSTFGYTKLTFKHNERRIEVKAHRAAWLLHYGEFPSEEIDHINGDKRDNRIKNLREATRAQNARNRDTKGVYFVKSENAYTASIICNGNCSYLGRFKTYEEAKDAYESAALLFFGEFARAA